MPDSVRLVFYDGECAFCNRWVQFILKQDQLRKFHYASLQLLQSESVQLDKSQQKPDMDTIRYLKNGRVYERSEAILNILRDLGGFWKISFLFRLIPRVLRDKMYDLIATNRYRFQKNQCQLAGQSANQQLIQNKADLDLLLRNIS